MSTINHKRRKRITVSTPEQWEAISSPPRFEIYTFLEGSGPCSVAELAALIDVPADSLYHHLRLLTKAELVAETGYRKKGRQVEAIYDVVAEEIQFDLTAEDFAERIGKLNDGVLRQCSRTLRSAVDQGKAVIKGNHRNMYARLETAWLNPEQLAEIRNHIESITAIFEQGRKQRNGQLMMACMCLGPVVRNRRNSEK